MTDHIEVTKAGDGTWKIEGEFPTTKTGTKAAVVNDLHKAGFRVVTDQGDSVGMVRNQASVDESRGR